MSGAGLAGVLVLTAVLLLPGRRISRHPAAPRAGRPTEGRRAGGAAGDGRPRRRRRTVAAREDAAQEELLLLLEALEPALRAGLPVRAALVGPVARTRVGGELAAADAAGEPLAPVWALEARRSGSAAAAVVHRAWRLSERTGSPLADGVADAAEEVRAAAHRRRRVAAAVAGPRATARLLTVLPLAGPLLALALGLRPSQLWGGPGGPLAVVGAVLVVLGHLWCRALLHDVTRARPVGSS